MKILNILELLCESKVNFILKRYFTKLQKAYAEDRLFELDRIDQDDIKDLLDLFISHIDPSEKYLEWIVKQYCAQMFRLEDLYQIQEDMDHFETNKRNMQYQDINKYNLRTMREELIKFDVSGHAGDFGEVIQNAILSKDIKVIEKGTTFTIYHTLTKEGNILLGKGGGHKFNRWCTARTDDKNMFEYYNIELNSDIYVAIFENGKRFQFDIDRATHLIMNVMNELDADIVKHDITEDLKYWNRLKQTKLVQSEYKKALDQHWSYSPYMNNWGEFVQISAQHDKFFMDSFPIAYDNEDQNNHSDIDDLLIDSVIATYKLSDVPFLRTIEWVRSYIKQNEDDTILTNAVEDAFSSVKVKSRIIDIFKNPIYRQNIKDWDEYIQDIVRDNEQRAKLGLK